MLPFIPNLLIDLCVLCPQCTQSEIYVRCVCLHYGCRHKVAQVRISRINVCQHKPASRVTYDDSNVVPQGLEHLGSFQGIDLPNCDGSDSSCHIALI